MSCTGPRTFPTFPAIIFAAHHFPVLLPAISTSLNIAVAGSHHLPACRLSPIDPFRQHYSTCAGRFQHQLIPTRSKLCSIHFSSPSDFLFVCHTSNALGEAMALISAYEDEHAPSASKGRQNTERAAMSVLSSNTFENERPYIFLLAQGLFVLDKCAVTVLVEGDAQFLLRVHDDGTIPGNRFADGSARNEQEPQQTIFSAY